MTIIQILQKLKSIFYTKTEIDSMNWGGGVIQLKMSYVV